MAFREVTSLWDWGQNSESDTVAAGFFRNTEGVITFHNKATGLEEPVQDLYLTNLGDNPEPAYAGAAECGAGETAELKEGTAGYFVNNSGTIKFKITGQDVSESVSYIYIVNTTQEPEY